MNQNEFIIKLKILVNYSHLSEIPNHPKCRTHGVLMWRFYENYDRVFRCF